MNTRRRILRWLPTLPIVGPLAVKAGMAARQVRDAVPSLGMPAPSSIHVIADPAGRKLPQLAVWWQKQGESFPIRLTPAGAFMVTVNQGLTLTHATMGGLVGLARQAYGLAH